MALVYNLLLNFKVLIWCESGNQIRLYYLLAVKDKIYCIKLSSGLTSFKSISIKPYFQSKNTCNIKLDELEVLIKLDKLEVFAKLNKLKAPLPIFKVLYQPAESAIKYS